MKITMVRTSWNMLGLGKVEKARAINQPVARQVDRHTDLLIITTILIDIMI